MKSRLLPIILLFFLVLLVAGGIFAWEQLNESRPVPGRTLGQTLLSPFVRAVEAVSSVMVSGLEYVVQTGQVRRENALLQEQVARLKVENGFLREGLAKFHRLDSAALLAESRQWELITANVLAYADRSYTQSLVVDKGRLEGVEKGDPVLHVEGLAGIVTRVGLWTATVQLLHDPRAVVGAMAPSAHTRGVVRGTGQADYLEITLEDSLTPLRKGAVVMTSGMEDSLYPRGIPIGEIEQWERNRFGQQIFQLRPYVAFSNIRDVLILKTRRGQPLDRPLQERLFQDETSTLTLSGEAISSPTLTNRKTTDTLEQEATSWAD